MRELSQIMIHRVLFQGWDEWRKYVDGIGTIWSVAINTEKDRRDQRGPKRTEKKPKRIEKISKKGPKDTEKDHNDTEKDTCIIAHT